MSLTLELSDATGAKLCELPAEFVGDGLRIKPSAIDLGRAAAFTLRDAEGKVLLQREIAGAVELLTAIRDRFEDAE